MTKLPFALILSIEQMGKVYKMSTARQSNQLRVVALNALAMSLNNIDLCTALSSTAQLLLIYLLTNPTTHHREAIAELFWPERQAKQTASNLRTVLTELRKVGATQLTITREEITLDPTTVDYDVITFRTQMTAAKVALTRGEVALAVTHWEAAVRLHQRPFLLGLREPASPDLQLWLRLERELLYHQLLSALRHLVEHYAKQGEVATALRLAQRWLALEPIDEDALQQVMRLLAQQGEAAAALAHYRTYLRLHEQEQATAAVNPALAALVDEIVQGRLPNIATPALPATPAPPQPKPGETRPTTEKQQPTNLPGELTPLIGRAQEIAQVRALLREERQRLVTIVGMGGQGKTRLALAVAAACQADYSDGVWFVALETVAGSGAGHEQVDNQALWREQLATAIAAALGHPLAGPQSGVEQVLRQLHDKVICLVLDNFEHLVAVAPFLTQLLEGAPHLSLLVTSRVRLNVLAERVYPLGGLALPTAPTPAAVAQSAAGRLFLDSAKRHLNHYMLDEADADAIAKLCQLTAGLPLALILASTWVEHLTPAEIVTQLEANLAFLADEVATLPRRQQNIAQMIEVSWQTLPPSAQLALTQLSVFIEPFSRQAAQAVADVTLVQLRTLTDKALLTVAGPGVYHFHPLIHHFARQKLAAMPDATEVRQRHAHYFQQLVQTMATLPATTDRQQGGQQHWPGYRDVCAALEWLLTHIPATGIAFLFDLYPLWERYGYLGDGRHWLQVGLRYMPAAALPRAHLLRLAGSLAEKQRDLAVAKQLLSEALQLYQVLQHAEGQAATLGVLGWVTFHERLHYTAVQPALDYFERSLQIYRTLGNRAQIANQLGNISQLLIMEKQRPAAQIRVDLEEALTIYQSLADRAGQALIWKLLGDLELAINNHTAAAIYLDLAIGCAETAAMVHDLAWIYHTRCAVAYEQQDIATLQRYSVKAWTIFKAVQDPYGIMLTAFFIGLAEQRLSNYHTALTYLRESLRIAHTMQERYRISRALCVLGTTALALHWYTGAALAGASEALLTSPAESFTEWERQDLSALLADAQRYCHDPLASQNWAQGKSLPLATVVDLALNGAVYTQSPAMLAPAGSGDPAGTSIAGD